MENLVEIDRNRVIAMGAEAKGTQWRSLYVLLPKALRQKGSIEPGDIMTYLQAPGSSDIVLRIEKAKK